MRAMLWSTEPCLVRSRQRQKEGETRAWWWRLGTKEINRDTTVTCDTHALLLLVDNRDTTVTCDTHAFYSFRFACILL